MRTTVVFASLTALALAVTGCELLVQLDRSAVDAGEDTGCPICTDGGDDSSEDALEADVPSAEASSLESGAGD